METPGANVAIAEDVLLSAAAAYQAALRGRLVAAYALGSLAHGGFSPLVSDIDLGLVVDDPLRPDDAQTIEVIAEQLKAGDMPLADRLSVFWGTPSTLGERGEGGRFPALDRLDLLENGRLLIGTEARSGLPRPSPADLLVAGSEFALGFLAGVKWTERGTSSRLGSMRTARDDVVDEIRRPRVLAAAGVRRVTKVVLFPVRFLFSAATGRVGTNQDAAGWYIAHSDVPSKSLVAAALGWRDDEPTDHEEVASLLREHLASLYRYYINDHIARLDSIGEVELASAFIDWRARLDA